MGGHGLVFVARRDGPRIFEPIGMDYQTKFAQCAPLTHINKPPTNDAREQSYFPPPTLHTARAPKDAPRAWLYLQRTSILRFATPTHACDRITQERSIVLRALTPTNIIAILANDCAILFRRTLVRSPTNLKNANIIFAELHDTTPLSCIVRLACVCPHST